MDDGVRIPLTNGGYTLVSPEDAEWMSKLKWRAHKNKGRISGVRMISKLHRLLLPDAEEVDHINGNTLDNRRCNLRPATRQQNSRNVGLTRRNSSGFKGVNRSRRVKNPWCARIRIGGRKQHNLGHYKTAEDAARAYDRAALRYHREFAWLNFPEEREERLREIAEEDGRGDGGTE